MLKNSFVIHLSRICNESFLADFLIELKVEVLFSSESSNGKREIYCTINHTDLVEKISLFSGVESIQPDELFIDWDEQSALHSEFYHEGKIEIPIVDPVEKRWKKVTMLPGSGFGDLSHPTTNLMLKLIEGKIKGKYVIDVGCGNGVLSLVSVSLGADHVIAIDIDDDALEHARENVTLNEMDGKVEVSNGISNLLEKGREYVILMNMISSEQQQAWESIRSVHSACGEIITSGVLESQRMEYLEWAKEQGWSLIVEEREDKWLGFYFLRA